MCKGLWSTILSFTRCKNHSIIYINMSVINFPITSIFEKEINESIKMQGFSTQKKVTLLLQKGSGLSLKLH